jgi:hypothetical protein
MLYFISQVGRAALALDTQGLQVFGIILFFNRHSGTGLSFPGGTVSMCPKRVP